jgi:gliding motility-associated-like protein
MDGTYDLKFRAVDSINHTSITQQNLRIVYDTSPPLHVSTTGRSSSLPEDSESPRVRNGDTLTVITTWDQNGYEITGDFTSLDSTSTQPIEAKGRGNGEYVFELRISDKNTYPDGIKTIPITAVDTTGNRTILTKFSVRLRNDLPTIISITPNRYAFSNGDTVELLVETDADDLEVIADFSELDSTYAPEKVAVTNRGDNTYSVRYTIGVDNVFPDKPSVPIAISVSDGLETVDSEATIALDNTIPSLLDARINQITATIGYRFDVTVANGSTVEVYSIWDGSGYIVSGDFSDLDSAYNPGDEEVEMGGTSESTYVISYQLSAANTRADGLRSIMLKAVDTAGNETQVKLEIRLDNSAPDILSVKNMDDDSLYKNGDTITLSVKIELQVNESYTITADFSEVDSKFPERMREITVSDGTDGVYTVEYTISRENNKALKATLSGLRITVSVADSVGNVASDSSLQVELDNLPPKLEIISPEADTVVNEAWVDVRGQTESDAVVKVEPRRTAGVSAEVPVDSSGNFNTSVSLNVGDNTVTVTANDVAGNETIEKLTINYRPIIRAAQGGTIYLPEKRDDGIQGNDTRIVIPAGAADRDFSVEITRLDSASAPPAINNRYIGQGNISPLVAYEFTLKDVTGQQEVYMTFSKPVEIYLQYQGLSKMDLPAAVFRWDGSEQGGKWNTIRWNRLGSEENRSNETVKITVNSLSIFGVFEGIDMPEEFELAGAFPNPFTPNNDGVNDIVSFYFENPDNQEAVIRIFDLRGALVRKLESGLTSWDGLDDSGEPAEMGVYVYQIEVGDKVEGNTIVLAR